MWLIILSLFCGVLGGEHFTRISRVIVEETCASLPSDQAEAYVEFEAAIQHAATLEFSPPYGRESLRVGLEGLRQFLDKSRLIDYTMCHELIVDNIMRLADYALLIGDVNRMRMLVQTGNLFKLVGIRNWYRKILLEQDTFGVSLDGRRAPYAKLYTLVSYRLQSLYNGLSVERKDVVKSPHTSSISIKSICAYPQGSQVTQLASMNHHKYSTLHGYDYELITKVPSEFDENPQFYKIQLLIDWLTPPQSRDEWLMLIDCDAFFTNLEIRVEDIIRTYSSRDEEHDILVAEDNGGINTGVVLVRRSEWARVFFKSAQSHSHMNMSWDQSMILYELLLRSGMLKGGPVRYPPAHVQFVHQANLNAFHEGSARSWNTYAWTPGDYVKHFAGCPAEEDYCLGLMNTTVASY